MNTTLRTFALTISLFFNFFISHVEAAACAYPNLQGCTIPADVSRCLTPTNDNQCIANKQGNYPLFDKSANKLVEGCYSDKFQRIADLPASRSCALLPRSPIRVEIYYQTICSDGRPKCLAGADVNVFPVIKADAVVGSIKMNLPEQNNQPVSLKNTSQSNASKSFCSSLSGNGYFYNPTTKQCDISVETQCSLLGMEYDVTNNKCISDLCPASVCTTAITNTVCKGYTVNPAGKTCACKGTSITTDGNGASCDDQNSSLGNTSLFIGEQVSCIINQSKQVKCWGYGIYTGQLGTGSLQNRTTPSSTIITNAIQGDAGYMGSCVVLADNTLSCWGVVSNVLSSTSPTLQSGVTDAKQVSVSKETICYLTTTGTVKCKGRNGFGQLGNGTYTNSSSFVNVTGLTNIIKISSSADIENNNNSAGSCALKNDGTVYCWGAGGYGQIGNGTNSNATTPQQVSGITNAIDISAHGEMRCAVLDDFTVKCWGELRRDSIVTSNTPTVATGMTGVNQISGGEVLAFCGTNLDGSGVKCWGDNGYYGFRGDGTTSNYVSTTANNVVSLTNVYKMESGGTHGCAILKDCTVKCWGKNSGGSYGALGNGATTDSGTPVTVSGLNACE